MKKRLLSFAVTVSIVASLFSTVFIRTYAEETYVSPDVAILENILNGDRHFVIDTLIGTNFKTDFSTNPHAIVNYIGNENTMMDNVLSQYQTDRVYKAAVDIMEKVYNSDEYAESTADFIAEYAADLLSYLSVDAANFVSDLSYSKSQLNYESILKETLSADYTASDGTELSTKEIELENLERIDKGLKNLKSFSSFFKSNASANHMNDNTFDDRMKYYNDYLIPYTDNMNSVLSAFADMQDSKGKSDEQKKEDMVNFVTFLAMLNQMDRYEQANTDIESDIVYYAPTFFVSDEALSLIKSGDKAISTVSKTLSTYMFIESIATQSDSMKGALTRMARTADSSLKPVLNTFANEIGEAGNQKLIAYESLMQYIRNAGVVKELEQNTGKFITKQISKRLPQVQALSKEGLLRTAASKAISDATAVVGISSWCADQTMSFGATCKKTYELKYLEDIIEQAIKTYRADLSTYQSNKTEENAKAVLDDLLLIQKLRLRGETIAYKMTQGQWNSPLGRILATGTLDTDHMLMDYLDSSYQARVDAFIGASAMPLSTDSLTIKSGETLTIGYRDDAGLYGRYTKADGKEFCIGELDYRIANGITVNSGGRILTTADTPSTYIPYIINNGGQVLISQAPVITELTQNSGTTVLGSSTYYIDNIELTGGELYSNTSANISSDSIIMSGTPVVSNINITTNDCNISSTWNMSDSTLTVNSMANVSGTLSGGNVYYNGDSSGGGGTIDNLIISGSNNQTLSGILNATNLTYSNTGTVNQSGTINVTGTVKNTSSKVNNGQNTVLKSTGSIYGNHYNSGLTLDGVTIDKTMTFSGTLGTQNTVNLEDVAIDGAIVQNSGTLDLNGDVTVKSDSFFGGTVTNNSTYYTSGDITVNSTNSFNDIITNGKVKQAITGTLNVNSFTNTNPKGVTVANTVNVSETLKNEYGSISGMGMTLLSGGKFNGNIYNGDVTIKSADCDIPAKITGNVVLSATNTINQNAQIGGYLTANSGTLTIDKSTLTVGGAVNLSTLLITDSDSNLNFNSDFTNSSTITGNSANFVIKGIMQNSGTINNCKLSLSKEFVNTGTVSGGSITTKNEIYNNGTINVNNLSLNSATFFDVSGNSIATTDLNLSGRGKVNLKTNINVSGNYTNSGTKVNDDYIIIALGKNIIENRTYQTLNVTTDLILDGCTVTADTLNAQAGIKLTNGAKLIVNKMLTASGSNKKIEIDDTSQLNIKKLSSISSYADIIVDGELIFGSDTAISSAKLSGTGTITVKGDLYGSSLTVNKPQNVNIVGKTPQIISASGASFYNLNISNTSRSGVKFENTVYYYGDYNANGSKVTGTVTAR